MRYSQLFIPTRREDPADAEVVSHKLLMRAGYMRMLARGIYSFLPLGWRVIHKIEKIIREEMDKAGALEVLLPGVQPAELWEESGRWELYGPELLRFKDRKNASFCLGPTHEEVITDMVRGEVRSYKQLPLNLYQIQTKFRDEIRPRAGLMRGREFVMKDAYSFDADEAGAHKSYGIMRAAYERTFDRMGFEYRAVEADTGAIGGNLSHEFQVLAQSGEDLMVSCGSCGYAANVEQAENVKSEGNAPEASGDLAPLISVETPNMKTVDDVTAFLKIEATGLVKTLLFQADDKVVAVLIRGDCEVNEVKVKKALGAGVLGLASEKTVVETTGAPVGYAGPVGLDVEILADWSVIGMRDFVVGGNAKDAHHTGANVGRDFEVGQWADLRMTQDGDPCPKCGHELASYRGIEIGHIFYLGTKYSEAMGATFLDESGKAKPLEMGCYGMGVTRVMAAVVEQNHDDNGMIWPMALAPYQVIILPLGRLKGNLLEAVEKLHDEVAALGVEVILDDRNENPGVKFKDADLIGVPIQMVLGGRGLKNGIIEVRKRGTEGHEEVPLESAAAHVLELVRSQLGG